MTTYFGFTFSAAMLHLPAAVSFEEVNVTEHKTAIEAAISCVNPTHTATIEALEFRFNITVEIPEVAPRVQLNAGDLIYILQVFGLPRLGGDRKEYSEEEVENASFKLILAKVS